MPTPSQAGPRLNADLVIETRARQHTDYVLRQYRAGLNYDSASVRTCTSSQVSNAVAVNEKVVLFAHTLPYSMGTKHCHGNTA